MFSLICARVNGWVNNGEAGDLRRHRAHYDVTVMITRRCGGPEYRLWWYWPRPIGIFQHQHHRGFFLQQNFIFKKFIFLSSISFKNIIMAWNTYNSLSLFYGKWKKNAIDFKSVKCGVRQCKWHLTFDIFLQHVPYGIKHKNITYRILFWRGDTQGPC